MSEQGRPKILFVCYFFPPNASVASIRPAKFIKYLHLIGWKITVLTRKCPKLYPSDYGLLENIPSDARIIYTTDFYPYKFFGALRLIGAGFLAEFIEKFVFFPDNDVLWVLPAFIKSCHLVRTIKPDVIYVSCVRPSQALIGYLLKKRFKIPVVLDFHNEWTKGVYYNPPTQLHHKLNLACEAEVITSVDGVITLNPFHTEDLQKRFPSRKEQFITIENGYDPDDFPKNVVKHKQDRIFTLTYIGTIYGYQSPLPLLNTLESLVSERKVNPDEVSVKIIGDSFSQFRSSRTYSFPVEVKGHITYRKLLPYFIEADLFFLCLQPQAARQRPAKIYEYMYFNKPVVAIAPEDGSAAELINSNQCGKVVSPQDEQRIKSTIVEFYNAWKQKGYLYTPVTKISLYDRQELTKKLDNFLRNLI